ncbi:hypothetical protein CPB97_008280 [Podila verticillata]|nr:hypothetical protein CPB97_008280 [Podila verticillata]
MSHSTMDAPVMDEDFDLCISETNLPFPYSDHCSTGPPSLYEFDNDESEEEEEEEEEEDDGVGEDEGTVRTEALADDSDDDPLTMASLDRNRALLSPKPSLRSRDHSVATDLSDRLYRRLEWIQEDDITLTSKTRPRFSRQASSFDSNGGWHEDVQEEPREVLTEQSAKDPDQGLAQTVISTVTSVTYAVGRYWSKKIYDSLLRSRDPQAYYTHLLAAATNYEQWSEAAVILDRLQGKDKWKNDPRSTHYDYELLQERLSQLASARESGDLGLMIFLLRTSLSRNLGNVGRAQLYENTIVGTKRLIEDYNSEVIRQLNIICDTESDDFSMAAKLEFFTHTRQAFGRTALLLSGGATMGLMHIGVIKTLFETHLLPRIISGSSCGSIIAAILCTRTDEEIPLMFQFDKFNFTVFHTQEEQGDVLARLVHFLKNGALFNAQVLKEALKDNIGDVTFQEAYNRTRRILNITVSTSATFEMPRLLNYLTAPNVLIWSAVATSCAAPFIYNSAPLMAKDKNGDEVQWNPSRYHWIDGSVDNDLPMNKLSELFNVNHFIVCQVNPYIVPFLQHSMGRSPANKVLKWVLHQSRSELQHRMNQLSLLGVMPGLIHKVQAIMSQRYYGDITIVPDMGVEDYLNIVSNPTPDSLMASTLKGEKATWPQISIIRNHCSIEHCLDDILYRLRLRRLQAFRAYPHAGAPLSKVTSVEQPSVSHASSSMSPLRSSASVCFGAIGRSNSSPASPTVNQNLQMSACSTSTSASHSPPLHMESHGPERPDLNSHHSKSMSLVSSMLGSPPYLTSGHTNTSGRPSHPSPRTSNEHQRRPSMSSLSSTAMDHTLSTSTLSSPSSSRTGSRHPSFSINGTEVHEVSTSSRSSSSTSTCSATMSSSPVAIFQSPVSELGSFSVQSPVPVVVQKNGNKKKGSGGGGGPSSSTVVSATTTASTSSSGPQATTQTSGSGRNSRSKRNRTFQMTSLETQ